MRSGQDRTPGIVQRNSEALLRGERRAAVHRLAQMRKFVFTPQRGEAPPIRSGAWMSFIAMEDAVMCTDAAYGSSLAGLQLAFVAVLRVMGSCLLVAWFSAAAHDIAARFGPDVFDTPGLFESKTLCA